MASPARSRVHPDTSGLPRDCGDAARSGNYHRVSAKAVRARRLPPGVLLNRYGQCATRLIPACLLHPGVALGLFTAFSLNRVVTFEQINQFDPYYFTPQM
jgi:hypothetical protein